MSNQAGKKIFCLAPWVHAYRGTDGFRSVCCLTTEVQNEADSFKEWWNSDFMKSVRKTFLAGDVPSFCSGCLQSNRVSGSGYNTNFLDRYGHLTKHIVNSTAEDGRTDMRPRSVDYRTAHCNLKCRTCDARNSSAIYAEAVRAKAWLPPRAMTAEIGRAVDDEALMEADFIYWAGGEPLMSPSHQKAMDELVRNGRSKSVQVHYTSNLMHWNESLSEKFSKYAESFDFITLGASIDGLGDVGAYIRDGWHESVFFQHLKELRVASPRMDIYLDVTLCNMGLLCLPELFALAEGNYFKIQIKLMECNGENDFLDLRLMHKIEIDRLFEKCKHAVGLEYYRDRVEEVRQLVERRFHSEAFGEHHLRLLRRSEERRGSAGYFHQMLDGKLNLSNEISTMI